jgi:hypothetical protein
MATKFKEVDVNDVLHGEEYESFLSELEEWVLADLSRRSEPTVVILSGEPFACEIKNLLFNLVLLRPFREFKYKVDVGNWFDGDPRKDLPRYFDEMILFFGESDPKELNIVLSDVIMALSALASRVNLRVATTISSYEIGRAMAENPRLEEIARSTFGHIGDFRSIENEQDQMMREAEAILMVSDTSLGDIIRAGAVNSNQLKQILVGMGPKSDLMGQLVPHLPDTNWLMGLRDVNDYYVAAESGRKVIITSHRSVRQSGYLTRKLSLLAIDTELDRDCPDCGTEHAIDVNMSSMDIVRRFRGRWCVLEPGGDPFIITDEHTDLVGRTVMVRSPMTCAGKKVCHACYGRLASVNRELHIGIVAVLHLTSQLTQKLLSAKHLVQTKSPELDWPTLFQKLFVVDRTVITVADDASGWMVLRANSILEDEDTGDSMIECLEVDVPVQGGKRGERESRVLDLPVPLYLTDEFMSEVDEYRNLDGSYEIPLRELADVPVFSIRIQNRELTTSLNQIKALIERKDHLGVEDIDGIAQRMIELLVANEIELDAVHSEVILRNMVRLKGDLSARPDFSVDDPGEYVVLRLVDAILHSPSVVQSLSFQDIRRQLLDPETYNKNGGSLLDPLFGG